MSNDDEDTVPNGMMVRIDTEFHTMATKLAEAESKRTGYRVTKTDIFRKALAAGFKAIKEKP